jgi:hypothetical protein
MDGTILGQGSFVVPSTVVNQVIVIPSNVDWLKVYNYTQAGTAVAGTYGIKYYWQRGMAIGTGMVEYATNATYPVLNSDTLVSGGFTLYDPTGQSAGALPLLSSPLNFTAITNATRPVVSAVSTAGVSVGSVVRLSPILANGTAGTAVISDLAGMDFVVSAVTANTSFELLYAGNAFGAAPGITTGTGSFRVVNYPPYWYPRKLLITNINTSTSVISTSTAHGLTVGQAVRFNIPSICGTVQLNPTAQNNYASAIVTAISADGCEFTVNVNMAGYTAFTFPSPSQQPSSFPLVIPFGEDTGTALSAAAGLVPLDWNGLPVYNANSGILADATINSAYLGMILGTGGNGNALGSAITGPAGSVAGDVMYWVAGKSSFGGL